MQLKGSNAEEDDNEILKKLRLLYVECTEERRRPMAQSSNKVVCRRPTSGAPKFAIGIVVKNKTNGLAGVIVSWDLHCKESDEWIEENGVRNLVRGIDQPFYRFLDEVNGSSRYEAEGNEVIVTIIVLISNI